VVALIGIRLVSYGSSMPYFGEGCKLMVAF
jgi:hypothetical protein